MDVVIGRELDFDDLHNAPDDGNRYEILDGALVTPWLWTFLIAILLVARSPRTATAIRIRRVANSSWRR